MTRNSPSSINVYNQCPRLYYYQFIEKKASFPHIDLIKGSVVHETLKEFFSEKPSAIETHGKIWAESRLKRIFMDRWASKKNVIDSLQVRDGELRRHYEECYEMILHWLADFLSRLSKSGLSFAEAFEKLRPIAEDECCSTEYEIKGFIDAIENVDGEIRIIDYKTTAKFEITKEYRLQLAVYAYLYEKKYGKMPNKVGIYFLKEKLHLISVDEPMVRFAEQECKKVHERTQSTDIKNYPQNAGYLCKALKGDCPCRQYEEQEE